MANGQFAVADIPGAINRGLQFRQQQQLRPLQQQQAQQQVQLGQQQFERGGQQLKLGEQAIAAGDQQALQTQSDNLIDQGLTLAAKIKSLPDEGILPFLQSQIDSGQGNTDVQVLAGLAKNGEFGDIRSSTEQALEQGRILGRLKAPSLKPQELELKREAQEIRKQETVLRRDEAEERKLDRQLARETNELKRQELETKIEETKAKVEQGKRDKQFNAESSIDAVGQSISTVDRLLTGSKLESAAGFEANFPTIAGSEASDFEATLETLQSQAFLSQVEKMKGLGALSENEGKKLGAAIGTLSVNQSDKALRRELGRVRQILSTAKAKMEKKFGISAQPQATSDFSSQSNEQLLSF